MTPPRRKARGDGFKKIDRIVVKSTLQGNMEFPLLFNVHSSTFLVEVDGADVFAKDIVELRAKVEAAIRARETLTWERWIQIDYDARFNRANGGNFSRSLNEETDYEDSNEEASGPVTLTELTFNFDVFDLSSPIALSEEARRIHRAQRYGDPPTHERLRKRLKMKDGVWEDPDDGQHGRVDADILEERHKVFRPYTDEIYLALASIRAGLTNLDAKLRVVLEAPDLAKLVGSVPLSLPAPVVIEAEATPTIARSVRKARRA